MAIIAPSFIGRCHGLKWWQSQQLFLLNEHSASSFRARDRIIEQPRLAVGIALHPCPPQHHDIPELPVLGALDGDDGNGGLPLVPVGAMKAGSPLDQIPDCR